MRNPVNLYPQRIRPFIPTWASEVGHLLGFSHDTRSFSYHGGSGDNHPCADYQISDCEFSSTIFNAFRRNNLWCHCQCFDGQLGHAKNNSNILILATVAASALFIWDYILTFGMEVDLVWRSKWNFMKGLYLFQRYSPFVDTVWLVLYRQPHIFSIFFPWLFFSRSNGGEFNEDWMSKYILRQWRFVKLTLTWSRREFTFMNPVPMTLGIAASESRFDFQSLSRVASN